MSPSYEQGDRLLQLLSGVKTSSDNIVQKLEDLEANIDVLNNNIYEVTYREIINPTSTTTGNIAFPIKSTLDTDDYPGNAILSTVTGTGEITGETPIFNGNFVTATLATNGNWVTSSLTDSSVAIIFRLKIKSIDYPNLDQSKIIDFSASTASNDTNNRVNNEVGVNYTVTNTDRNIIVTAGVTITFPTLATITHFEDISITNDSASNVTLTSVELLGDVNSFVLYPRESLTFIKGTTKYIVK